MIKVTLIKSKNGCIKNQIDNLRSLNLRNIGDFIDIENTAENVGRLRRILHLVKVEVKDDKVK